ncbi:MAG: MarR family transcriptional regulator [Gammaproteobacteria bacterium]|nr:MarR family transcriptional regulator [Gammaproteobacteria bacterium]
MPRQKVSGERRVAELALQLGRAAYGESSAAGLTPAQWMALRFFARANRFSRTVSAFAEFHSTTRGTASQTVKSLVERGFLTRTRCTRDRRSTTFDLTEQARRQLMADPFEAVVEAAAVLSPAQRDRTARGLQLVLHRLSANRERPALGACARCGHLGRGVERGFTCQLMQEPLSAAETEQLCVYCQDGRDHGGPASGS